MIKNDVASFFYYMWNSWCMEECQTVFTTEGWEHFWSKWKYYFQNNNHFGAAEEFFANLDQANQDRIVKRAITLYNRKERIG